LDEQCLGLIGEFNRVAVLNLVPSTMFQVLLLLLLFLLLLLLLLLLLVLLLLVLLLLLLPVLTRSLSLSR